MIKSKKTFSNKTNSPEKRKTAKDDFEVGHKKENKISNSLSEVPAGKNLEKLIIELLFNFRNRSDL